MAYTYGSIQEGDVVRLEGLGSNCVYLFNNGRNATEYGRRILSGPGDRVVAIEISEEVISKIPHEKQIWPEKSERASLPYCGTCGGIVGGVSQLSDEERREYRRLSARGDGGRTHRRGIVRR